MYTEDLTQSQPFTQRWVRQQYGGSSASSYLLNFVDNSTLTMPGMRKGERVLNWREKIAKGENASSYYERSGSRIEDVVDGTAHVTVYPHQLIPSDPQPSRREYMVSGLARKPYVPPHQSASLVKAEAMALSKTLKKVKEEYSAMNTPAILAEIGDVLRQFGHPFRAIVDLSNRHLNRLALERRGLQGSTIFKRQKWAEIVASSHLEYSFGLAPLISDTRKLAETVARWKFEATGEQVALLKPRAKIVSRGIDTVVTHTESDFGAMTGPLNTSFYDRRKTTTEARVQYTVGLQSTLRADFGSNDRLLQLLGFDHGNWIPAAWEAIPWSWLIDYFTNVQQILDASVTRTNDVKWICRTESLRTEQSVSFDLFRDRIAAGAKAQGWSGWFASGHGGRYKIVSTTMKRTIPPSLGVPPLVFEIPTQVGQLANMAAVLISKRPSSSALWLF